MSNKIKNNSNFELAFYIYLMEDYLSNLWQDRSLPVIKSIKSVDNIAFSDGSPSFELNSLQLSHRCVEIAVKNLENETSIFSSKNKYEKKGLGTIFYKNCSLFNFNIIEKITISKNNGNTDNQYYNLIENFFEFSASSICLTIPHNFKDNINKEKIKKAGFYFNFTDPKKGSIIFIKINWQEKLKNLEKTTGFSRYYLKKFKPNKFKVPKKYDFSGIDLDRSITEIAKDVGCHTKTVRTYLAKIGKREIKKRQKYDWDNYDFTGKSSTQISKETGCNMGTARYQLRKRGLYNEKPRKNFFSG